MKKVLILVLLLVLVTSLFSCKIIDKILGRTVPPDKITDDSKNTTDEAKLNLMFENIKGSIDVSESSPEISDIIKNELSKLDFSLEDIELDGESSGASVIFKNNTLYITSNEYAEQIIRFSEYGILTVSEANQEVTSSLITYDELLPETTAIDIQSILDSLVIKQGDLQKTDTEHVYTVNNSLLLRLGKAIFGNSDFTVDRSTAPTITIDMRKYDTSNTVKISILDKSTEETTEITLSVSGPEDARRLQFTVTAKDTSIEGYAVLDGAIKELLLDANITQNNIETSLNIEFNSADNGTSEMKMTLSSDEVFLKANATISENDNLSKLDIILNVTPSDGQSFSLNMLYDSSAISKVGENVISSQIKLYGEDNNSAVNLYIKLTTDEYSDTSKRYSMIIESKSEDDTSIIGSAKIYSPAKSSPKISKKATLYFDHGSKILLAYPTYLAKAESLNNQMIELIKSGRRPSSNQWVTRDSATGIYFITSVSYVNGAYLSTTYSSPDAFRYAYGCAQNLGGFEKEGSSLAEREARRLAELIEKDIPDGSYGSTYGTFYTYTYIEEFDVYLMFASDFPSDFVLLTQEPSENDTYATAKIHKLAFDEKGNVKIHNYVEKISEWNCHVSYECSHCGATPFFYVEDTYSHNLKASAYETDSAGNMLWDFVYCDRCGKCEVNIYKGEVVITLALEEMSESIMYDIRRHEGMEDFRLSTSDFTYSLVIARIEFNGEFPDTDAIEIVIPELSKFCEYKIVGIDDAMFSYSNSTPLSIVLSDEIEFINEMAFMYCEFVTKISAPSSLRFIGRMAFCGCENLTEVILGGDNVYIGEDAFDDTSIEITA